jgi:Purine catabolism regulatory protein-like family
VLTVADVLDFSVVRRGLPEVVSGDAHLDREVRWAHVLDVADASGLLKGREFVLNTGQLTLNDVLHEMSSSPTLRAFIADRLGPLLELHFAVRARQLLD